MKKFILLTALILAAAMCGAQQPDSVVAPTASSSQNDYAKPLTRAQKKALKAEQEREVVEEAMAEAKPRLAFAKTWEESWLRSGNDVSVVTSGPKNTILTLYWTGVSKSFFFNFNENQRDLINQMKQVGFLRLTIAAPPTNWACNVEDECRHTWIF